MTIPSGPSDFIKFCSFCLGFQDNPDRIPSNFLGLPLFFCLLGSVRLHFMIGISIRNSESNSNLSSTFQSVFCKISFAANLIEPLRAARKDIEQLETAPSTSQQRRMRFHFGVLKAKHFANFDCYLAKCKRLANAFDRLE